MRPKAARSGQNWRRNDSLLHFLITNITPSQQEEDLVFLSPRFGEVREVHLSNETPADASVITVLQQHPFLPAVCLVALCPVSAHPQVELHKLGPLSVQVPAH